MPTNCSVGVVKSRKIVGTGRKKYVMTMHQLTVTYCGRQNGNIKVRVVSSLNLHTEMLFIFKQGKWLSCKRLAYNGESRLRFMFISKYSMVLTINNVMTLLCIELKGARRRL